MNGDELKEEILKEMGVGMFAALASETPAPTVEEVDADYNEVEGETPDGETAEGNINRVGKARVYVESPEQVPEGFEAQEGQQGGIYYEPDEGGENFTQDEWEQAGLQILDDFDEDDYRWDYWEGAEIDNVEEGSIVHISDEMFAAPGDTDGPLGVVVEADPDTGEYAVVTEDGDMVLAEDYQSLLDGEAEQGITSVWDSPDQDNIRTGWDDNAQDEEEEAQRQQEIESGERAPHWADEDPFKDVTDSDAPESGLNEGGLYYFDEDIVELERAEDYEGDVDVYQTEHYKISDIDGILCRAGNPNDIDSGEVEYFDFADGSGMSDGWYQVSELDENEDGDLGWEIWNSESGLEFINASDVMDNVEGVHRPVENTYQFPELEDTPEPSGSTNPDDWTIDWESTDDEKTGKTLPMAQKKLLMREWKSAVDSEAAESVSNTIRDIKDSTFNTQGQKYDKLIKAVMGAEGEPRSGDFEDAEEPTEEEIEAMKVLQDASQKFFETHYGDSTEVHRGLAEYSHKSVLPKIGEVFQSGGDISGSEIELEDNPSGVWSTEAGAARAFTVAGSGIKSLKVSDHVEKEDVFNMPDAIYPYEQREEVASIDSDWDEGEVNTPSNGKRISADDIEVVNVHDIDEEGNVAKAPLTDVLHHPEKVLESGQTGAINRFLKTLDDMGGEDFYESYKESLQSNEAVTNHEDWDKIEEQIGSIEYDPNASIFESMDKQDGDVITIDLTGEDNSNWLNTTTDYVLSQEEEEEEETEEKARRYVNDPSEAPDDVEVQEGPRGGYYYEDEAQTELDDFSGERVVEPDEMPDFYEEGVNEYVLDFMQEQGIETVEIPDHPTMDDVRDAKETWQEAMDYLKEHKDDLDEAMKVVTFAANRRDEMRRRRNESSGGGGSTEPPDNPDPVTFDEIQESYDYDQIPDDVPDELDEMYAVADMSDSYRQFANSVLQNGLLDISNRQLHRFGRAFSSDEEYEVDDLTTLPEDEMSALAQGDLGQETMQRIQEAQQGEDGTITMYRAVPDFVDDTSVGDYVALNPEYAQRHGEKVLGAQQGEAWHVLEQEVPIEDVVWPGEVASEFVYSPKEYRERWSSLKEFYEDANNRDTKSAILERFEKIAKERVYVNDTSEVPEGVQVQEGEQGGIYYETEDLDTGEVESGEVPSAEELISEVGLESMNDVQEVIARGITEGTDLDSLAQAVSEEKSGRYVNRVLNDVAQAVSKDMEGYESQAKMVYSWDDDFDFPDEAQRKFMESVDEEAGEIAKNTLENWPLDFFGEELAPLWKTVMAETGNSNLLRDEESITDTEVSDEEMEAVKSHKKFVEDTLREMYGDTITVYRGVYGDAGGKLTQAAENGEEIEWERRAVESYTTDLSYAKSYAQNPGGVVVEDEIPVEDVWASSYTGFLDANENELVVQRDSVETISPDKIHTPETLDDGAWNIKQVAEQAREFRQ